MCSHISQQGDLIGIEKRKCLAETRKRMHSNKREEFPLETAILVNVYCVYIETLLPSA